MAQLPVVRRYVQALFDVALRQDLVDQVESDLAAVDALLHQAPRLMRILRAPTIARARKRALLGGVFGVRVTALTLRFMQLLVEKRRETVLEDARAEFRRLAYAHRNLLPVEVTTAIPLAEADREALRRALERRTAKRVELHERVDESILGGVTVRLGDTILDGSVRAHLEQLRTRLRIGAPGLNGRT
ncbi:MAG: ATP synthase F1 subunit delta [Armatimonadetes bacterium]|nr:ATP synthase F1 subunit delta [Armatimonadota bacterium]